MYFACVEALGIKLCIFRSVACQFIDTFRPVWPSKLSILCKRVADLLFDLDRVIGFVKFRDITGERRLAEARPTVNVGTQDCDFQLPTETHLWILKGIPSTHMESFSLSLLGS